MPAARPRAVALAALADLLLVAAFVLIGRASHERGDAVLGFLGTLWPFAAGLALGWLLARAWRSPRALGPIGLIVWAATVVIGLLLRLAAGQGVQPSFAIVTALVLGAFLLGWRGVAALVARRRPAETATRGG
ncbi:DUF3054 domain-containing protein [Homoserinibacter sp. YIM 151385]|uniref:DUF3054 domain-containing protein n=1 Tax=Homoserinibacter sp. YIM 151385 TaxID=2985506 RepID=UPI0022F13B23|nr:DUF3054 domain-containing protein [Homoserinibacter sp. YIM 151385]WBU39112.1 DUF3054 domain-containing protein [Homoserinibacter sp. YIM 151385]